MRPMKISMFKPLPYSKSKMKTKKYIQFNYFKVQMKVCTLTNHSSA